MCEGTLSSCELFLSWSDISELLNSDRRHRKLKFFGKSLLGSCSCVCEDYCLQKIRQSNFIEIGLHFEGRHLFLPTREHEVSVADSTETSNTLTMSRDTTFQKTENLTINTATLIVTKKQVPGVKSVKFNSHIYFVYYVSAVMNLRVPWNEGKFLTSCKPVSFSRRTLHHGVIIIQNC